MSSHSTLRPAAHLRYAESATLPPGVHAQPGLPLILRPTQDGPKCLEEVLQWYGDSRTALEDLTLQYGAVLLRGFALPDSRAFGLLAAQHTEHEFRYLGGASPRARLSGNVYESTRIDPRFRIELHQEKSYMPYFPRLVAFYCERPADSGGDTLVCDMREVTRCLPAELKRQFAARGVRYKRNFRDRERYDSRIEGSALREYHRVWQEAFDCEKRDQAQRHCQATGLQWEWLYDGSLTVSNVRPAFIRHPSSGEDIWFNQSSAQHANARSLGPMFSLLQRFYSARPAYPYEVQYGDGGEMELADLLPVYSALQEFEVAMAWQAADYLLIDNIRIAHGRSPYVGARAIRVALMD
jgi:alpha-ketoglutarate-dependent taurine dioxygenase